MEEQEKVLIIRGLYSLISQYNRETREWQCAIDENMATVRGIQLKQSKNAEKIKEIKNLIQKIENS